MITIRQHTNFSNWFQVFSFGRMVDEFSKRADAIELARSIAKDKEQPHINVMGNEIKIK